MNTLNKTVSMIDKCESDIRELSNDAKIEIMYNNIKKIAKEYDVEMTENARKIARARVLTDCPLNLCICDRNDPERGCISAKCMKEIKEEGICHCKAFRKKKG